MKKVSSLITIALAASMFQACNNNGKSDSKTVADSANTAKDSVAKDTASKISSTVEPGDAKFAVEAASGGMTEVALGKVAEQKGGDQRIKNFGAMMVKDHGKADDKLMTLAKTKNITLPSVPDASDQKDIDGLSQKSGADFDKAYVNAMFEGHKKVLKMFENAAKNCSDPDLKAFAENTVPVIQKHLDAITAIKDSMK
jgi:putative membrane protein